MFKVELIPSTKVRIQWLSTYFVKATNSGHHDTMIKLKHGIVNLLQQWGILWLSIVLR